MNPSMIRQDGIDIFPIPYSCFLWFPGLTWGEILWGYRNGLVSSDDVIICAENALGTNIYSDDLVNKICWLTGNDVSEILDILVKIDEKEKTNVSGPEIIWLNISMARIADQWYLLSDQAATLEYLLVFFNYPDRTEKVNIEVAGAAGGAKSTVRNEYLRQMVLQYVLRWYSPDSSGHTQGS